MAALWPKCGVWLVFTTGIAASQTQLTISWGLLRSVRWTGGGVRLGKARVKAGLHLQFVFILAHFLSVFGFYFNGKCFLRGAVRLSGLSLWLGGHPTIRSLISVGPLIKAFIPLNALQEPEKWPSSVMGSQILISVECVCIYMFYSTVQNSWQSKRMMSKWSPSRCKTMILCL